MWGHLRPTLSGGTERFRRTGGQMGDRLGNELQTDDGLCSEGRRMAFLPFIVEIT